MKKAIKWLDDYLEVSIGVVLMSLMTIIIFIQVIARYVLHNSLSWSEELARYLFIWIIYLGISYGCKVMKHIKIDACMALFPRKARPYVELIGILIFLAFAVYIAVTGFDLTMKQIPLNRNSPAMGLPMQYVYAAPAVGMALSAVRLAQAVSAQIKKIAAGTYNS